MSERRNILLTLEFDGTDFCGWQLQPQDRTVQGVLEEVLRRMTREEELRVTGSGRTDSGVHALGMGVSFFTKTNIPLAGFLRGLNAQLPPDMVVLAAQEVPLDFCARRSARGKRYRYRIWNDPLPSALERHRSWHLYSPLDLEAMREASNCLLGQHDFSAFRAAGCTAAHPVRRIYEITIRRERKVVVLEFEGTAFLRHMVRNLVGSLVEVGLGRHPPSWLAEVLASCDRSLAGPGSPPTGLYLVSVRYELPPERTSSVS